MKNSPNVLVVDDDANLRKTLADILRFKGYTVAVAANGAEAIAEAARTAMNVALIDLKLPDMSGIAVMEKIKAASPFTEAIILTGHASMDSAVEATNKGAFSYLLKPYEIDSLLLNIRHAVDRQQNQQEIVRLASFPEMNPNPVLEINVAGEITYLNPAAAKLFPQLVIAQPASGMLGDFPLDAASGEQAVREISIGNATFEQFLSPVPERDLIRIYMLDITERKQHEVKLNRLNQRLNTLRNIDEFLLAAESEEALFRVVCAALRGLDDTVGVIIASRQTGYVLKPVAWAGFDETMIAALNIRWDDSEYGRGLMGIAAREKKTMVAADLENDARYEPWREIVQTWQLKSAAAVPLLAEGDTMGVLAIYSGRCNSFDEETILFLIEVANDIAMGVHSLRQDRKLRATLDSLRKSLDGTVETVARMMEMRDPYTAGHERRVAQLACDIGKAMGLPERQVEGLRVIGYLHDIGKIAVPAEILSKPSRLTEVELAMVKSHAKAGYDILRDMEFPWPVAQAVWQHHERLDGTGYPQGLKGDDIILEARILMVADVVEAMASHRPYRPAIGLTGALAEISTNRGKYYDERVVDACLRLFIESNFKFKDDA
ncbi:MAG: response regulator [Sideroxydans sp.]|nr:response regulator [Sideroxydans sp.]